MSGSRTITNLLLFFILFTALLFFSCSEDSDNTDAGGDGEISQSDGDSEQSDGDLDPDLEERDIEIDNEDSEIEEIEPDSSDGDYEEEVEEVDPDSDYDGPDLPTCGDDGPYPCVTEELPFEYTDNEGEFRFGSAGSEWLIGSDVWEDWILFFHDHSYIDEIAGLFLVDYQNKQTYMLSGPSSASYYPCIRDNKAVWTSVNRDPEKATAIDDLYITDMAEIVSTKISSSKTPKDIPLIYENQVIWENARLNPQADLFHIFTFSKDNEEVLVDHYSDEGVSWYDLYGRKIVYVSWPRTVVLIDFEAETEEVISDSAYLFTRVKIWGNDIFWSDNRMSDDPYLECGQSIIRYNITTGEESVLKQSDGITDYLVEDVWEDWLLYSDFSEGGGWEDYETCRYAYGHADLMLHYLPTGEEWNITNQIGNQDEAHMWGHLVVWSDSRENPSHSVAETQDIYGRDLCMHPELKTRFPSCPDYIEE